ATSRTSSRGSRRPASWGRRRTSRPGTGRRWRTSTPRPAGPRSSSASIWHAASARCRRSGAHRARARRAGSSPAGSRWTRRSRPCWPDGSATPPRRWRSSTRTTRGPAGTPVCAPSTPPGPRRRRRAGTDVARHGAQLLPEVPRALRAPVEDYLTLIELERGLSRNTVDAYARDLGRYLAWLDDRGTATFSQVTEQDLLAF